MTLVRKLPAVVQLAQLRLRRCERRLADAAMKCAAAARALAAAERHVAAASSAHCEAEHEFRQRPQCQQRQLLRHVRAEQLGLAQDARAERTQELDGAEAERVAAAAGLRRQTARLEQIEGWLRRERLRAAEQRHEREQDEWTPRAQAA